MHNQSFIIRKHKNNLFLITFALSFYFCSGQAALADTHEITNCTAANVQSAVNTAVAGDSVYLNCSGTNTWSSSVSITKGIEIYGRTCITNSNGLPTSCPTVINSNGTMLFSATLGSSDSLRMHDLSFTGSGPGTGDWDSLIIISGNSSDESKSGEVWNSLRMDHLMFTNIGWQGILLGPWYTIHSHPKALFDHINFYSNGTARAFRFEMSNSTWQAPDNYGTEANTIYIEDSSFVWAAASTVNASVTDTEHGTRFVVRAVRSGCMIPEAPKLQEATGYWKFTTTQSHALQAIVTAWSALLCAGADISFITIPYPAFPVCPPMF
jgi:hypothetical protein